MQPPGAQPERPVQLETPAALTLLAEVYGHMGRAAEGLTLLEQAQALVDAHGERWWEAEVYRLKGELLLHQPVPDVAQAMTCLQQALAIARHQGAKALELRAATSLSRLWQQQRQREEAHQLLAPIYNGFTEGFDTADLLEAKALLEALRR